MAHPRTDYEAQLEVRTSTIPHAGDGVFTRVGIPKGAYLGAYEGALITDEELRVLVDEDRWHYAIHLIDCAARYTKGPTTIDGTEGNAFTRMNYAPEGFRNVRIRHICRPPYVKVFALRDIAAGEELWVDYGSRYRYDFMEDPAVIGFFSALGSERSG